MNIKVKMCKHCTAISSETQWAKYICKQPTGLVCRKCTNSIQNKVNSTEEGKARISARNARAASCPLRVERRNAQVNAVRATPEGREKIRAANRANRDARRANDPMYRMRDRLQALLNSTFKYKGYDKSSSSAEVLGADFDTVAKYLGCKDGIPNGTAIDHILPIALARNEADLITLNHYTNLQLLDKAANLQKSDWVVHLGCRARDLTDERAAAIVAEFRRGLK